MKPLVTALGILALLMVPNMAYGQYTWTGAISGSWESFANWSGGTAGKYPGENSAGETATIDANTSYDTVVVTNSIPNALASVAVDADTANVPLALEVNGSITCGSVSLMGDGSSAASLTGSGILSANSLSMTYANVTISDLAMIASSGSSSTLTLPVSNVSFGPSNLELYGYDADYKATLDIDNDVNLSSMSVEASNYVDIDVAENYKLTTSSATVGNSAEVNYLEMISAGEWECSSMDIDARAAGTSNDHTTLKLSAGTLDVNGAVSLYGDTDYDAEAILWVYSGTLEPDSIDLYGGDSDSREAVLDLDQSVTLTTGGDMTAIRYAEIDVENGDTLTLDDFTVGNAAYVNYVEKLGAGELDCNSVVIDARAAGQNGDNTTLKVGAGTLDANVAVVLYGDDGFTAEAELEVSNGATCTPESVDLNGGSADTKEAVLDIDQSVTVGDTGTTMSGYVAIDVAENMTLDLDGITIDGTSTTLTRTGSGTCKGDSLSVAVSGADRTLTVNTGTLDSVGAVTLTGDETYTATLAGTGRVSAGSLALTAKAAISVSTLRMVAASGSGTAATLQLPTAANVSFTSSSLELEGLNSSDKAKLDITESVDKSSMTVDAWSYAEIEVDSGILQTSSVTIGNGPEYSSVEKTGAGEWECSSLTIDARAATADTHDVIMKLTAGTLDVNGAVTLYGDSDYEADATLWVYSGTLEPNSIVMSGSTDSSKGDAILNLDQSVTVQSTGTTVTGNAAIQVAKGTTFTTLAMSIGDTGGDNATVGISAPDGSGSATISCSSIVIDGGSSSDTTVTLGSDVSLSTS